MKKHITELVFILDESGSMYHLKNDTIGGFNSMIDKQKEIDGTCYVTTILFNTDTKTIHDRVELSQLNHMNNKDYNPNNATALMDTIGYAIHHISHIHKYIRKEDIPTKTLFVIMTDGYENASHQYNKEDIRKLIKRYKEKHKWEFLFIGANIDSKSEAKKYGIDEDMAVNYQPDAKGSKVVYESVNDVVGNLRKKQTIKKDWNKRIEEDYTSRSK